MTQRREMGNAAKNATNEAAEEISTIARDAEAMVADESLNLQPTVLVRLSKIAIGANKALRWLESIGAQTKP